MYPSPLLCVLLAIWSVLGFYNSVFPILLGLILMECAWSLKILTRIGGFGCGFFVFGFSFSLGNALIVILVVVGLGIRVLQIGGLKGFCSSKRVCDSGFDCGVFKESRKMDKTSGDHYLDDFVEENEEEGDDDEEGCGEDEVCSVVELRRMVKEERRRGKAAVRDLEKERMAAASAAEEAMAMILRLQNEKSVLQIEASQTQRLGEERQGYDQEVIVSLQRAVMQYEDERSLMEQQVKLCKKRLRMYLQEDEIELLDCMTSPCSRSLSRPRLAGCRLEDLLVGVLD